MTRQRGDYAPDAEIIDAAENAFERSQIEEQNNRLQQPRHANTSTSAGSPTLRRLPALLKFANLFTATLIP
jgi:hypothetical protein